MFEKLFNIYLWFKGLNDAFELKAKRFFFRSRFFASNTQIKKEALALLNQSPAKTAILIEKYYHGYSNYSKTFRKQMYLNLLGIEKDFSEFCAQTKVDVQPELGRFGLRFDQDDLRRLELLKKISMFLRPSDKLVYKPGVAFSQLCAPSDQVRYFDCNQICTLYLHLYALEYDVVDLNIKLPKDHICLHFKGLDIEATNGEFLIYKEPDDTFPITEIMAVNLLDVSDLEYEKSPVAPKVFYKMTQFARRISNNRIIEANMQLAYQKMALYYINHKDFQDAEFFVNRLENVVLRNEFLRRISDAYIKLKNYKKAIFYAKSSHSKDQCMKTYSFFYNLLLEKLKNIKYLADARKYKSTYKKMLTLARKMQKPDLVENLKKTLRKL